MRLNTEHAERLAIEGAADEYAALLRTVEAAAGGESVTLAALTECRHNSVKRDPLTTGQIREDLATGVRTVVLPRHVGE